jgi:hypothetical protein
VDAAYGVDTVRGVTSALEPKDLARPLTGTKHANLSFVSDGTVIQLRALQNLVIWEQWALSLD